MTNYRRLYARMARRAVNQGVANLEAFVQQFTDAGATVETVEQLLLEDLENDGPIFGNFFRALAGAGESAVNTAHRQGVTLAQIDGDAELERLLGIADADDAVQEMLDNANPEQLEALINDSAEGLQLTWVAELRNTCHRCLPLHGKTQSAAAWRRAGLDPSTIHSGWTSACHCLLKSTRELGGEQVPPLRRIADKKGISRKTNRAVGSRSLAKSVDAVNQARESLEGRRTLKRLGEQGLSDVRGKDRTSGG